MTRTRLTRLQVANVMASQYQVWKGTPNARQIIDDCCHALANGFGLKSGTGPRLAFLFECASKVYNAHQCKVCGDTFHSNRADAQFCSSACRQRNYRKRKELQT